MPDIDRIRIALSFTLAAGLPACSSTPPPAAADLAAAVDMAVAPSPDLAMAAAGDMTTAPAVDMAAGPRMSFFITSETGSANYGGLAGADARCTRLAEAAGVRGRKWAAYLSTYAEMGRPGVDARDRIGAGPWYNAKGDKVADNVAGLHDAMMMSLNKQTALDEKGNVVLGRGDMPNQHDIVTGSTAEGRVNGMATCLNWTTDADTMGVVATVGHHDRQGGGAAPTSWNAAHDSRGCSASALVGTGGAGRFYCFAID